MTIFHWLLGILIVVIIAFGSWYAISMRPTAQPATVATTTPASAATASAFGTTLDAQGNRLHHEEGSYYTIDITYPATTGLAAPADQKAMSAIEALLASSSAQFISDTKDEAPFVATDRGGVKLAYTIETKAFSSSKTISYEFDIYSDTGGAHPNEFYQTLTFDREGNQLQLSDLFTPGSSYLQRISAAGLAQVQDALDAQNGGAFDIGAAKDGTAPTPDNWKSFVIDKGDLVFLLPPYQVAAYAAGSFTVRIPLSSLSDILNPTYF